jgi:hypothetical protein
VKSYAARLGTDAIIRTVGLKMAGRQDVKKILLSYQYNRSGFGEGDLQYIPKQEKYAKGCSRFMSKV